MRWCIGQSRNVGNMSSAVQNGLVRNADGKRPALWVWTLASLLPRKRTWESAPSPKPYHLPSCLRLLQSPHKQYLVFCYTCLFICFHQRLSILMAGAVSSSSLIFLVPKAVISHRWGQCSLLFPSHPPAPLSNIFFLPSHLPSWEGWAQKPLTPAPKLALWVTMFDPEVLKHAQQSSSLGGACLIQVLRLQSPSVWFSSGAEDQHFQAAPRYADTAGPGMSSKTSY